MPARARKTGKAAFLQVKPNIYRYRTVKGVRYAVRLVVDGADRWTKGFLSQDQAGDYLGTTRFQIVQARHLPHLEPAPTLDQYVPRWLKDCEVRGLRPTTIRSYRQNLEDHIQPELGAMPLDQITRQHVKELLRRKQETRWGKEHTRPYSQHALRLMLAPLSALFSDAVDSEVVDRNPCLRPAKLIEIRKKYQEPTFYSASDQATLLAKAHEIRPAHALHLAVLFWAGLRPGEASALTPTDIDLVRNRIKVSKTFTEGQLHDTPKNGQTRLVEILPELRPILVGYLTKRRQKATLLFPNEVGGYLDAPNWRRRVWDPVIKAAKVPALSPYAARHSYATRMLEQGKSLAWLQVQMGHSSIAVTIANYGHLAEQI